MSRMKRKSISSSNKDCCICKVDQGLKIRRPAASMRSMARKKRSAEAPRWRLRLAENPRTVYGKGS